MLYYQDHRYVDREWYVPEEEAMKNISGATRVLYNNNNNNYRKDFRKATSSVLGRGRILSTLIANTTHLPPSQRNQTAKISKFRDRRKRYITIVKKENPCALRRFRRLSGITRCLKRLGMQPSVALVGVRSSSINPVQPLPRNKKGGAKVLWMACTLISESFKKQKKKKKRPT